MLSEQSYQIEKLPNRSPTKITGRYFVAFGELCKNFLVQSVLFNKIKDYISKFITNVSSVLVFVVNQQAQNISKYVSIIHHVINSNLKN